MNQPQALTETKPLLTSLDSSVKAAWHALMPEEVLRQLQSDAGGLTEFEVADRQKIWGFNRLPGKEPPDLFDIFNRHAKETWSPRLSTAS